MNYVLRLSQSDSNHIPVELENDEAGKISFEKLQSFSFDKHATPDSQWIEFVITCVSAVPLSVLANVIYAHLFQEKPKVIEEYEEEITIEKPDGSMIQIRKKHKRTES